MFACRKVRGLIAASVYGEITDAEQMALEGHLASCAACRVEAESLKRLASGIPAAPVALDRDLLPAVRRRLAEPQPVGPRLDWRFAYAAAAALVVVVLSALLMWRQHAARVPVAVAPAESGAVSPAEAALREAIVLAEDRNFAAAYRALKDAVDRYPEDAAAGEAQRRRADLAFAELRWYPEAWEDYQLLAERYPAAFRASAESIQRREILDEAEEKDFAPLYALDAARRRTEDAFAQLEQVIGRYPGTYVASAAAEDMARLAIDGSPGPDAANGHLLAMECARDRCVNPIAKQQLSLELGHIYRQELKDPGKACILYNEVVAGDEPVLARLGRESLADLGC